MDRVARLEAVILDMDGVVTDTAGVHARAWKRLFDAFLGERSAKTGAPFEPFDAVRDYLDYVDGKPRYEGVRSFLRSRGIELPEGGPEDGPEASTVVGLGNRKDAYFAERLHADGVEVFGGTVERVRELRSLGASTALVTSSKHGREVIALAGLGDIFDAQLDGNDIETLGLKGKPNPDLFLEAASRLDVAPARAAVVEDALSGVQAGRAGGFGLVIGVDRGANREALEQGGADVVVSDLAELQRRGDPDPAGGPAVGARAPARSCPTPRRAPRRRVPGLRRHAHADRRAPRPRRAGARGARRAAASGERGDGRRGQRTGPGERACAGGARRHRLRGQPRLRDPGPGRHGAVVRGRPGVPGGRGPGPGGGGAGRRAHPRRMGGGQGPLALCPLPPDPRGARRGRRGGGRRRPRRCAPAAKAPRQDGLRDPAAHRLGQGPRGAVAARGPGARGRRACCPCISATTSPTRTPSGRWPAAAIGVLVAEAPRAHGGGLPAAGPGRGAASSSRGSPAHAGGRSANDPDQRLVARLRRLRPGAGGAARGAVHARQRLLRHARRRAEESQADDVHYPGTYLAGGYNRLVTEIAGRAVENEDLVNMPNWLPLTFRPEGGDWFDPTAVELLDYRQVLDMREGCSPRAVRFRDGAGRETRVSEPPHRAHGDSRTSPRMEYSFTCPRTGPAASRCARRSTGAVVNAGVPRYRQLTAKHLRPRGREAHAAHDAGCCVETAQSRLRGRPRRRARGLARTASRWRSSGARVEEPGYIAHGAARFELRAGRAARGREGGGALHLARPAVSARPALEAREAVAPAPGASSELLDAHALAWGRSGAAATSTSTLAEPTSRRILRLHIFHLLQTVSPHTRSTCDVGVPARGLHGEAYRGHIFWDELFIFPFLNLRFPRSRAPLLLYRYRRLRRAREAARGGRATAARCSLAERQRRPRGDARRLHLNPRSGRWLPDLAAASATSTRPSPTTSGSTTQVTGDREFLALYGAEMLLEIARFWASIATLRRRRGRYEIHGVMGPDEYHDGYPDRDEPGPRQQRLHQRHGGLGAGRALEVLDLLPPRRGRSCAEQLGLAPRRSSERWDDISRRMRVPFHGDGIISQFEGYERLSEFDWDGYRAALRRTSRAWTGSWRPRATRPPLQARPSRPTC